MKRTRILGVAVLAGLLAVPALAENEAGKRAAPADDAQAKADTPSWKKVTYLGVTTTPVGETLGRQLQLPPGVGLVASFVAPDSPAKAAGVRQHDVLVKFGDQLLILPQQLAVLIHIRKPKEKVVLTLIREGKEEKVTAELGETEEFMDATPEAPQRRNVAPGAAQQWRNLATLLADRMQWHVNAVAGPGGAAASVATASSSDGEHTLTLTSIDGHKRLLAKDKENKVVFDGPVDTPEQLQAVPEAIRGKVENMVKGIIVRVEARPAPASPPAPAPGQDVLPQ